MIDGDLLTARVHLFKALADRTRLQILEMLSERNEMSVTEIYRRLGRGQNLISHHLACLKNCGLAASRRQGKQIYYRLRNKKALKLFDRADTHVRDVLESVLACEVVSEEKTQVRDSRNKLNLRENRL
jgi:DNA-binding transcriptional ArsR family regulator